MGDLINEQSWDEYNKPSTGKRKRYIRTNIKCPECGENLYYDSLVAYPTCPLKFRYLCECGWEGTSFKRWRAER